MNKARNRKNASNRSLRFRYRSKSGTIRLLDSLIKIAETKNDERMLKRLSIAKWATENAFRFMHITKKNNEEGN